MTQSFKTVIEVNIKKQQDSIGGTVNEMTKTLSKTIDTLFDNFSLSFDEYKESLTSSISKIKDDFESSLEVSQSGFNNVVRDIRESLDDIRNATDNLQITLGGDLSDTLDNLAGYIKHYDELKQSDINTIKEIENLCRKK